MRFVDITNQRFGMLVALKVSETRNRDILSWDCMCDCGNTKVVTGQELRRRETTSCGCQQHRGSPKNITGIRRGSLIAIESTNVLSSNGDYKWKFMCDCGNEHIMTIGNFNSKENPSCKSCGMERSRQSRITHGFAKNHKTYKAWCKIKERCFNPNDPSYPTYGAVGITMSPEFVEDFMNFYNEIGEAPSKAHSVDRIDHTKNYEKGNIRWATLHQQARNKGKMKNNSSGFTGVHWENKLHPDGVSCTTYAVAQWKEYQDGVMHFKKKSFSIKKYGFLEAFAMACSFREQQIKRLNTMGYGYADNHGI